MRQPILGLSNLPPETVDVVLSFLPPRSLHTVLATNAQLWQAVQKHVTKLHISQGQDFVPLTSYTRLTTLRISQDRSLRAEHLSCLVQGGSPGLRSLDLSSSQLTVAAIQQLASVDWSSLTSLNLEGTLRRMNGADDAPLSTAACRCLAAGSWPQLKDLNLSVNCIDTAALRLLREGHWPALEKLNLSRQDARLVMFEMAPWTGVKALIFNRNDVRHVDLQELGATWPHLTSLSLRGLRTGVSIFPSDKPMEARYIMSLAAARWSQLAKLDLCHNQLTAEHFQALSHAEWPQLTRLHVGGMHMSEIPALPRLGFMWRVLRHVEIRHTSLEAADIFALVQLPGHNIDTFIAECQVSTLLQARPALEDWPNNTQLLLTTTVNAATLNSVSQGFWPIVSLTVDTGAERNNVALAVENLVKCSLSCMEKFSLELDDNELFTDIKDVTHVVKSIVKAEWPALRVLSLSGCSLYDEREFDHVSQLVTAAWPLLEEMDLSNNYIGKRGVKQLAHGKWPCLKSIDLVPGPGEFNEDPVGCEADLSPLYAKWPELQVWYR